MYISPTEAQPCCFHTADCIALLRPLDVLTLTGLSSALHVDALSMCLWLCSTKSAHGCTCSSTRDTSSRLRCACASCSTASAAACRTRACLVIAAVQMPCYQASGRRSGQRLQRLAACSSSRCTEVDMQWFVVHPTQITTGPACGPSGRKRITTSATAAASVTSHSPSDASTRTPLPLPGSRRTTLLLLGWQDSPRSSSCRWAAEHPRVMWQANCCTQLYGLVVPVPHGLCSCQHRLHMNRADCGGQSQLKDVCSASGMRRPP